MVDQTTESTFSALRYFLIGAVYRLSAEADDQIAYLDQIFAHMVEESDASVYGSDELALELDDTFLPLRDRNEEPCLTNSEKRAIIALDRYLEHLGGEKNWKFWQRNALREDYRWMEVRKLAKVALREFEKSEALPPKEEMMQTNNVIVDGKRA